MIDGFATESHYLDHLLPVVEACGGRMLCGSNALLDRARQLAPTVEAIPGVPRRDSGPPVLVAGYRDAKRVNRHRRLGLLEHGAGQTYLDALADPHYAGGLGWEHATLILTPGPHAASYWHGGFHEHSEGTGVGTFPAVVELHGTPRLDRYVEPETPEPTTSRQRGATGPRQNTTTTTGADGETGEMASRVREAVGVSFHWDCRVCPETGATWREWLPAVEALARERAVLGTAHPRAWRLLSGAYRRLGVPATAEFSEVIDSCWLYVCDNSSTMFEWAGLGRPVLALTGSRWRNPLESAHGLRFYDAVPGPSVPVGADLAEWVGFALGEGAERTLELGAIACEQAYGVPRFDGQATVRAVRAIEEHLA